MEELTQPNDRDELKALLGDVQRHVNATFDAVPADAFFRQPADGVWSPAEHLLHLVKSVKAVAGALRYPKLVLAVLFGRAKASRTLPEVVELYQGRLAAGGRAGGPYVPSVDTPADDAAATAARERLLASCQRQADALVEALGSWNEKALDRRRLPHPLIGKLTVREMLFFTAYHNLHHAKIIQRQTDAT